MSLHRRTFRRRPAVVVACAIALGTLPATSAMAQGPVLLEAFVQRHERSSEPLFGGVAISSFRGPLGVRLSGALHSRQVNVGVFDCASLPCPPYSDGTVDVRDWTADADIVLEPFRPVGAARTILLGFSPYAFAGIGGRGVSRSDVPDTSVATASFGAGVRHQFAGPLTVGAEARYRRALRSDSAIALGDRSRVEYRVALGFSFGGRRHMTSEGALARADAESCGGDCAPRAVERRVFAERTASRVLDRADAMVGKCRDAFDFVQAAFASEGVQLPTSPRRMMAAGSPVPVTVGSLRPGDLLFFASDRLIVDHVAIYVGGDRVVHASNGHVRYDVLGEGARGTWLAEHLVTARRIVTGDEMRLRPRHSP